MSADEARTALTNLRTRVEAARSDPTRAIAEAREGLRSIAARAGERATQAAASAKTYATRTSWIALGTMVLSLLAALGGALAGARGPARVPVR
jgi:CHASE3 domain sensor protein